MIEFDIFDSQKRATRDWHFVDMISIALLSIESSGRYHLPSHYLRVLLYTAEGSAYRPTLCNPISVGTFITEQRLHKRHSKLSLVCLHTASPGALRTLRSEDLSYRVDLKPVPKGCIWESEPICLRRSPTASEQMFWYLALGASLTKVFLRLCPLLSTDELHCLDATPTEQTWEMIW